MSNEELVKQIQSGEDVQEGMKQLWEQNKGLIYKIAFKYVSVAGGVNDVDDLLQQGYLGLHRAAESFDSKQGASFINYASYWIKQSISRYVKSTCSSVRLADGRYSKLRQYKETVAAFEGKYNRKPTDKELCRVLDVSQKVLKTLQEDAHSYVSELDAPVGEDGTETKGDFIPSQISTEEEFLDKIRQEELHEALEQCIEKLPDRQQELIRQRYYEGKSIDELASSYHVTHQRISDLHQAALNNLRKPSVSRGLHPFLPDNIKSIAMRGSVSGFKRTHTSSTERAVFKLLENEEARQSILGESREGALRYILAIEDSLTRTIFYMRIMDGLLWEDIAERISREITAEKVKQIYHKYLNEHPPEMEKVAASV